MVYVTLVWELQKETIDVLEIDAASNTGVDNIRELIDGVGYKPQHLNLEFI